MDKHTRPYMCTNPSCNGINLSNKAGLPWHERERHGAARYFCPTLSCIRHRRGFARKRNLDAHFASRHNSTSSTVLAVSKFPESENLSEGMEEETAEVESVSERRGLNAKLRELEMRKEELTASQMKVDEDIPALKRTMELVATTSEFLRTFEERRSNFLGKQVSWRG